MRGDTGDVDLTGVQLDDEQDVDPYEETASTVKKSQARIVCA
ncbi:hypothetical protein [Rhizocola hellebori]|nr:hypothetical protein [Rhizocola hellebori]